LVFFGRLAALVWDFCKTMQLFFSFLPVVKIGIHEALEGGLVIIFVSAIHCLNAKGLY